MIEQSNHQKFPLWILGVVIPAVGVLLLCCIGAIGFVAYRWVRPAAIAPQEGTPIAKAAKKENLVPKTEPQPKNDADQREQGTDLVVIFQHTPGKSVAKLVKRGSPIPPGWQGGAGRLLNIQVSQAEGQLSATLANGKEGQTATLTNSR
jgi:hypothetical protein